MACSSLTSSHMTGCSALLRAAKTSSFRGPLQRRHTKTSASVWANVSVWTHSTTGALLSRCLRANFVPADDEGHLSAPRVDEAGPAGVQGDVVAVLTAEPDGWVFKRWLTRVLQNWRDHDKFYKHLFITRPLKTLRCSCNGRTSAVQGQHEQAVIWMQAGQNWGTDQVLREVTEQRHRTVDIHTQLIHEESLTTRKHIYFKSLPLKCLSYATD